MGKFKIVGGNKLHGSIVPQGAKNEAMQIICACLLTKEKVTITNLPDIADINNLISLIQDMGVSVDRKSSDIVEIQADNINFSYFETEEFSQKATRLRGSVMILGPMLARFGKGFLPKPGGDKIGRRRLDTHIIGLQKLGATFENLNQYQKATAPSDGLKGAYMLLDEASVTGTANIIMAAVMAKGETTIFNAACEPYIVQLCRMLVSMGAIIKGIGSNLLKIEGVSELKGTTHRLLADMIEVGSFIGMAAMTGSELTIKNAGINDLGIIPDVFRRLGIKMEFRDDDIYIPAQEHYEVETFMDGSILTVSDAPWPGFTPDLISIALVLATQAKGTVLIHQKMFESRLFGAIIKGIGSNLLKIEGVSELKGTTHRLLADMIEVGSFIGMAAMTGSELTIKNAGINDLGIIPDVFRRLGIKMEFRDDDIYIPAQEHYEVETFMDGSILTVSDAPWPGFTPDLISIALVLATQAKGTVLIHQKMFESRLFFVDKLIDMGAQIILCDPHRATVVGLDRSQQLHAVKMASPDIRAGVALLIAALSAKGTSIIENIEQIDRGYQNIDGRLRDLGVDIERIEG